MENYDNKYYGNVNISYPSWVHNETGSVQQYCGYKGFGIICLNGKAILGLSGDLYYVKDINYTDSTLTLVDIDVTINQTCPRAQCLNIGSNQSYVLMENHETEGFDWSKNCEEKVVVLVTQTQINIYNLISGLGGAMNDGFVLDWERVKDYGKCESSQGYCGYNAPAEEFLCFCNDGSINSNSCKVFVC
ncbi:hypothetical protein ACB092_04G102700 [Castanea dentata]